jgi:hypothetical protein
MGVFVKQQHIATVGDHFPLEGAEQFRYAVLRRDGGQR